MGLVCGGGTGQPRGRLGGGVWGSKGRWGGGPGVEGGPRRKATGKGGGRKGAREEVGDVVGKWCGGAVGKVG